MRQQKTHNLPINKFLDKTKEIFWLTVVKKRIESIL